MYSSVEQTGQPDPTSPLVLHVEGDEQYVDLFAERVSDDLGAEVRSATTVADANAALDECDPDCVVSNSELPDGDGIAFLAELATNTDAARFLLTEETDESVIDAAVDAEVDGYFAKCDAGLFQRLVAAMDAAIDRSCTEIPLRRRAQLLESLTSTLPGVVYRRTIGDWRVTYLGEGLAELSGYDIDTFVDGDREWLADVVHPDDVNRLRSVAADALDVGEQFRETYRISRADGEERVVREHGTGVFEDDELVAVEGYIRDVTEERERRERLANHRDTVRTLHEAAVRIQTSETRQEVFEALVETAEEVLGFGICCVNRAEDDSLPIAALSTEAPPDGYSPVSADEGLVGKAYTEGRAIVTPDIGAVDDANPQGPYASGLTVPIGRYGVFQAVSEQRDAFGQEDLDLVQVLVDHCLTTVDGIEREKTLHEREQELRRQNERLEQFAGVVSHDLRNPLSVARGWTELLDADPENLARIQSAHDRMEAIIEDVLTLAREGDPVTETETSRLEIAVERAWDVVETESATLSVDSDVTLDVDSDRFGRLLENLFSNAVEHTGTDVTVTVGRTDTGFYVADDGPGIPPEDRERVFESGVTTADSGTGFGLAIVATVAEAHGWTVEATESADGGARFEFDVEEPA